MPYLSIYRYINTHTHTLIDGYVFFWILILSFFLFFFLLSFLFLHPGDEDRKRQFSNEFGVGFSEEIAESKSPHPQPIPSPLPTPPKLTCFYSRFHLFHHSQMQEVLPQRIKNLSVESESESSLVPTIQLPCLSFAPPPSSWSIPISQPILYLVLHLHIWFDSIFIFYHLLDSNWPLILSYRITIGAPPNIINDIQRLVKVLPLSLCQTHLFIPCMAFPLECSLNILIGLTPPPSPPPPPFRRLFNSFSGNILFSLSLSLSLSLRCGMRKRGIFVLKMEKRYLRCSHSFMHEVYTYIYISLLPRLIDWLIDWLIDRTMRSFVVSYESKCGWIASSIGWTWQDCILLVLSPINSRTICRDWIHNICWAFLIQPRLKAPRIWWYHHGICYLAHEPFTKHVGSRFIFIDVSYWLISLLTYLRTYGGSANTTTTTTNKRPDGESRPNIVEGPRWGCQ